MPFSLNFSKRSDGDLENHYVLKVRLLDHTTTDVVLNVHTKGKECLEKLSRALSLQEISYFGLQYVNRKQQLRWVNPDKSLKHQLTKHAQKTSKELPHSVFFKVQLFVDNCLKLKQEITRYFYYLQLKAHVTSGLLCCGLDTALRLAAYAVQAEFGDHDQDLHTIDFLQDFILLPKKLSEKFTTDELNLKISGLHLKNIGMSPAAAEVAYITECQQLDGYGVEFHPAKDKEGTQILIVPSFMGIRVEHSNGLPPVYFKWPDIGRMAYNRQYFCIESTANTTTVQFETRDTETAKYIWRMCVTQHQFFRLSSGSPTNANIKVRRELLTDTALSLKCRESPTFQRRLTLSRKKIKEQSTAREEPDSGVPPVGIFNSAFVDFGSFRSTNDGSQNGFTVPSLEERTSVTGSISSSISSRVTAPSSGYNSSDSDVEGSVDYSRAQPVAQNSLFARYSNRSSRSPSPARKKFTKSEFPTRDQLLKQLERVIEDNEMYSEFEQVFTRKLNCNISTATMSINSERNRNKDIVPYEESRIILDANCNPFHNDYINASLIKMDITRSKSVSFIAAQGPLENTVNDFWQMIWEQEVAVIAMVTREKENDVVRCSRYWPGDDNGSTKQFGNFIVTLQSSIRSGVSVSRTLKVTLKSSQKSADKSRNVVQVQYVMWPDNGVPENVADFVEFLEELRSLGKGARTISPGILAPQTVIHCSAGAGRTGIVILSEVIINLIENNQPIDVGMTLARLRTQRMNLVQAANQYRFVYLVLVKYLQRNRLI